MSFYVESTVKSARKPHLCEGCQTLIQPGESYLRISTQYDDGTPCRLAYHDDCRGWEIFLCQENNINSDEWCVLHEHVSDGGYCVLKDAPQLVRDRFAKKIRNWRRIKCDARRADKAERARAGSGS